MERKTTPRRTRSDWESLIAEQKASGLTIEQFCRQYELTQSNFYLWRKRLSQPIQKKATQTDQTTPWLQVAVPDTNPTPTWDIELDLPNGVTLRMRAA